MEVFKYEAELRSIKSKAISLTHSQKYWNTWGEKITLSENYQMVPFE